METIIENLEGEIWKPVVGYEGLYEISNKGRLKGLSREYQVKCRWGSLVSKKMPEKLYKPYMTEQGYWATFLFNQGRKHVSIHRLVATAFCENPDNKPHVNHKDSNRLNNTTENLEFCTHQENMIHGYKYGNKTIPLTIGSNNGRALVSELVVIEIRKLYKEGSRPLELQKKYNMTRGALEGIIYNKNWKHLL